MRGLISAIGLIAVLTGCTEAVPAQHSRSFKDPQPEDIEFMLYTRSNKNTPERLIAGDLDSITSSHFDPSLPVEVVLHGFNENADTSEWMPVAKDEYLRMEDATVILVNWKILAGGVRYDIAHNNALYVGEQLAVLLHFIKDNNPKFSGAQVHIVGFSLGAHAAGAAGKDFAGVARITGLDAAGPLYDNAPVEKRLDPTDAEFVDIIHSNAGFMLTGHFGFHNPLGHVDFYVNGGSFQFGCPNFFFDVAWDLINLHPEDIDACSHGRSHEYYIESLQSEIKAKAFSCQDYETFQTGACMFNENNNVGYHADSSKPGVYYLNTMGESEFFGKHLKLTVEIGGDQTYHGQIDSTLLLNNNRKNRTHELTSGWPSLTSGDKLSVAMIVPGSDRVTEVHLLLSFVKNELLPLAPDHVDIIKIEAENPEDNSKLCYGSNVRIITHVAQVLSPTSGAC